MVGPVLLVTGLQQRRKTSRWKEREKERKAVRGWGR